MKKSPKKEIKDIFVNSNLLPKIKRDWKSSTQRNLIETNSCELNGEGCGYLKPFSHRPAAAHSLQGSNGNQTKTRKFYMMNDFFNRTNPFPIFNYSTQQHQSKTSPQKYEGRRKADSSITEKASSHDIDSEELEGSINDERNSFSLFNDERLNTEQPEVPANKKLNTDDSETDLS